MSVPATSLAVKNLLREPRRLVFVGLMTAAGVLAAGLTIGYMTRMFSSIQESTIRSGVAHLQIATPAQFADYEERPLQNGLSANNATAIAAAIGRDPRVRKTMPRVLFSGLIANGSRSIVFTGTGGDPIGERMLSGSSTAVVAGDGLEQGDQTDRYRVVIGIEMARILGLKPGDSATLMSATVSGGLNAVDARVVGISKLGVPATDRLSVAVPLELAQELLQTDRISRIAVVLWETSDTDAVRSVTATNFKDVEVRPWRTLAPLYDQLQSLYARQFLVMGSILIFMVALPIANMTALSVTERTRDIGTLRVFGISEPDIRRIFVSEGLIAAIAGGAVGALLTWAFAEGLTSLQIQMPPPPNSTQSYPLAIRFEPFWIAVCIAAVSAIGAGAAWVASRGIANISIAEALRAR